MENMPEGFILLLKKIKKEQPISKFVPKNDKEIWEKFLRIVFLGGSRSDAEINYLIGMFGPAIELDYVNKTRGEAFESELSKIITQRIKIEKNQNIGEMLQGLDNEMFRIVASMKGAARYFERVKMSAANLEKMTKDKETTWEFINELVEDEDVTNVKFTKVILWLHSVGRGEDFSPPSRQIKDFCNKDIGPYYRFYEDDKYFMNMMQEITEEMKKDVPKLTVYDVSKAAFYYRVAKGMAGNAKGFTPKTFLNFMKKEKMDLDKFSGMLGDIKKRELLAKKIGNAFGK
jgi:hypothetical protein